MSDVASSLLLALHGSVLRHLCQYTNMHFAGLSSAARHLRKAGLINNKLQRQLSSLDATTAYVRHISAPYADGGFLHSLETLLPVSGQRAGGSERLLMSPPYSTSGYDASGNDKSGCDSNGYDQGGYEQIAEAPTRMTQEEAVVPTVVNHHRQRHAEVEQTADSHVPHAEEEIGPTPKILPQELIVQLTGQQVGEEFVPMTQEETVQVSTVVNHQCIPHAEVERIVDIHVPPDQEEIVKGPKKKAHAPGRRVSFDDAPVHICSLSAGRGHDAQDGSTDALDEDLFGGVEKALEQFDAQIEKARALVGSAPTREERLAAEDCLNNLQAGRATLYANAVEAAKEALRSLRGQSNSGSSYDGRQRERGLRQAYTAAPPANLKDSPGFGKGPRRTRRGR
mmetsp:Transcript_14460/g.43107  ORF Transcript_14460/g.43107 Transcript_14460/m.43107 type:complete len:395 (-) Transcript_14460:90-1274(-)